MRPERLLIRHNIVEGSQVLLCIGFKRFSVEILAERTEIVIPFLNQILREVQSVAQPFDERNIDIGKQQPKQRTPCLLIRLGDLE